MLLEILLLQHIPIEMIPDGLRQIDVVEVPVRPHSSWQGVGFDWRLEAT